MKWRGSQHLVDAPVSPKTAWWGDHHPSTPHFSSSSAAHQRLPSLAVGCQAHKENCKTYTIRTRNPWPKLSPQQLTDNYLILSIVFQRVSSSGTSCPLWAIGEEPTQTPSPIFAKVRSAAETAAMHIAMSDMNDQCRNIEYRYTNSTSMHWSIVRHEWPMSQYWLPIY